VRANAGYASGPAATNSKGNAVIPAGQFPERLPAGTHVRLHLELVAAPRRPVEGLLTDLPEFAWENFEAASRLAIEDTEAGRRSS
jgi:hypothetical protein